VEAGALGLQLAGCFIVVGLHGCEGLLRESTGIGYARAIYVDMEEDAKNIMDGEED